MNKSAPIKVLWIDDQPTEEMVALFASEGIEIEVCENYSEGIEWLKAHSNMCDAVILDVNCKETSSSEEVPSMKVFGQYRVKIISLCDSVNEMIPYFIYTGGGYAGADSLNEYTIERKEWWRSINKVYYAKPSDIGILIDDIKKASLNRTLYKYKNKYADIFSNLFKSYTSDFRTRQNNRTIFIMPKTIFVSFWHNYLTFIKHHLHLTLFRCNILQHQPIFIIMTYFFTPYNKSKQLKDHCSI